MSLRSSLAIIALFASIAAFAGDRQPWQLDGEKAGDEITGPDGGTMVWVPPGEFMMGAADGRPEEQPVHKVRLTRGFWLRKCTVTNAQYRRFCQETGLDFPSNSDQGDLFPVVCVDWKDAAAYCAHCGLSLPTEAQWEYAARGPQARRYPWGNDWSGGACCNWNCRGPNAKTFPVGSFPGAASWCGALDMAGNVWQWCKDWYDSKYYAASPDADPSGPAQGEDLPAVGQCHVLRGGSWSNEDAADFRSARRWYFDNPTSRRDIYGFRCAAVP